MEVRRIGPDGGFLRDFSDVRDRVRSLETRSSGNIVIRETLITEDPLTGVKTIIGELPDGTYGFQPFVGDIVPPPVATTPVVSAEAGFFTVSWDGKFSGNEASPPDFAHLTVVGHKLDGPSGTTVTSLDVGAIRLSTDTVFVATDVAKVNEYWQFSFESVDYNGNTSARSTRSIEVRMKDIPDSVGDSINSLQADIDTANTNASNAQTAANDAQTAADQAKADAASAVGIADGKGKVLTQSTAPAPADQNANTLWIDTTNGANTPKRWDGSSWVTVTDKAATDAATAAVNAQTRADQAYTAATNAATAAGNAQTSADAKNRIWYQDTAPAGTGHKANDVWFDTTNGANKPNRWNGSAWVVAQDAAIAAAQSTANTAKSSADGKTTITYSTSPASGSGKTVGDTWFQKSSNNLILGQWEWSGSAWLSKTVDNALIANIDAGKIVSGFIDAARIKAGSIAVDKLLVSSGTNLAYNGSAEYDNTQGYTGFIRATTGGPAGIPNFWTTTAGQSTTSFLNAPWLQVKPNTQYKITVWVKADKAGSVTYLEPQTGSTVAAERTTPIYPIQAVAVPTVWTKWTATFTTGTAPAKVLNFRWFVNHSSGTATDSVFSFTGFELNEMNAGDLIVDGAITTNHMTSGTIDAGVLSAGSITAPKIAGKTITADKLVLTSTDNLIMGGDFTGTSWQVGANNTINATAGRGSLPAMRFSGLAGSTSSLNLVNRVTVEPDNRFRCSIFVKSSSALAADRVRLMIRCYTDATNRTDIIGVYNTSALVANTWTQVKGISTTIPAGTIAVEFYLFVTNPDTTTTTDIDYVSVTRAFDANLVVDGAIDGQVITGATVRTAASGARIELNSTGLYGWNAAGVNYMVADSTGISLTGRLSATGSGRNANNTADRDISIVVGDSAQRRSGTSSQQWPPPSADSGIPTPGLAFKPVGVTMYQYAGLSSLDGYGITMSAGYSSETSTGATPSAIVLGLAQATIQSKLSVQGTLQVYNNPQQSILKRVPVGIIGKAKRAASGQFTGYTNLLSGTFTLTANATYRIQIHIHAYANLNNTYAGYDLSIGGTGAQSYTKPYAIGGYGDTTVFVAYYTPPSTGPVTMTLNGQIVVNAANNFVGFGTNSIEFTVEDVGEIV